MAVISEKLKIYIEKNMPERVEMALGEFLSKEIIKKFGIQAEILNDENECMVIKYKILAEPKIYAKKTVENKLPKISLKRKKIIGETVEVNYSLLSAHILFDEIQEKYFIKYVPSLKFSFEVFFLLNKIIGFKQKDFIDYYSFVLGPPDPVARFPKISNKADLAGEPEYMFVSEAREYLPVYCARAKHIIYGGNNGKKDQGRQIEEILKTESMKDGIICALNLPKPSLFFDCNYCELCDK